MERNIQAFLSLDKSSAFCADIDSDHVAGSSSVERETTDFDGFSALFSAIDHVTVAITKCEMREPRLFTELSLS